MHLFLCTLEIYRLISEEKPNRVVTRMYSKIKIPLTALRIFIPWGTCVNSTLTIYAPLKDSVVLAPQGETVKKRVRRNWIGRMITQSFF